MLDSELVAAARLGDEDAFRELYQRHIAYVRSIGRGILRRSDVDDMCQETFLLAFTRLDRFQGKAQFRSWITRIAVNHCLVTLRKSRQPSNGDSYLVQIDAEMADDTMLDRCVFASVDRQLEGVAVRLDMDRMLRVLKPLQRRVLELAYLEELPDLKIAEMLGMTLTTVKSRICHAKQKIRRFHQNS
jgi:RNA polymerase sigma-70 factor (ECF subfamily)